MEGEASDDGEAVADWSARGRGNPDDVGSSPATTSWQFWTIPEWQIMHVLSRSSMDPNFGVFGQEEQWGQRGPG